MVSMSCLTAMGLVAQGPWDLPVCDPSDRHVQCSPSAWGRE